MVGAFAVGETGLTSPVYAYHLVFGIGPPSIITSSLYPTGLIFVNSSIQLNFTCTFSAIIKRPSTVAAISLIDASTSATIATVQTSNKKSISYKNDTMFFTFGTGVIQANKTYYISIPAGKKF
jgi:hypothetical protein